MLGGYVADVATWRLFDHRWRKALRHKSLAYWHMEEFWANRGDFGKISHADKLALVRRLVHITDRTTLFGFTVRLDNADYQTFYCPKAPRKPHPDSQFGLCFRSCLSFVPECVASFLGRNDITVNFVLEDGHRNIGDAERIFNAIRKDVPEIGRLLGSFTAGEKKRHAGLQCADALVSAAIQQEPHTATFIAYTPDSGIEPARQASGLRSPVFRSHADQPVLTELLDGVLALKAIRHQMYLARKQAYEDGAPTTDG